MLRARSLVASLRLHHRVVLSSSFATKTAAGSASKEIALPARVTVSRLAEALGEQPAKLMEKMRYMRVPVGSEKTEITFDTASLVALEYDMICTREVDVSKDLKRRPPPENYNILPQRAPVVTIMGHVDHGKTTLLDSLRKTNVAAGEAGGITQHIGAFSVLSPGGKRITFLDTPGHAAFSAMRARGAQVTDIVILVVASDDGVMPQTIEALNHSLAAEVPIIVALNKCDVPVSNEERIKKELIEHGLALEEAGGDVQVVKVSGLKRLNLDRLEEAVIAQAEVMDLRAETDGPVEGSILEARVDKGRGNVATVLIQRGTLRNGDILVAGRAVCKVKLMTDYTGKAVECATPSLPVEVPGWKQLPYAGDEVLQAKSMNQAEEVIELRSQAGYDKAVEQSMIQIEKRNQMLQAIKDSVRPDENQTYIRKGREVLKSTARAQLNLIRQKMMDKAQADADEDNSADKKILRYIVKSDVIGSLEAIVDAIQPLEMEEVGIRIMKSAVGQVSLNDVNFAAECGARILAFNSTIPKDVQAKAKSLKVVIRPHNIIYRLLEEVDAEVAQNMPPVVKEEKLAVGEILQVFRLHNKRRDVVAGCRVTFGTFHRSSNVQLVRNDVVVFEGSLDSLKHLKNDVNEITQGMECGMSFTDHKDVREGDIVRVINKVPVAVTVAELAKLREMRSLKSMRS